MMKKILTGIIGSLLLAQSVLVGTAGAAEQGLAQASGSPGLSIQYIAQYSSGAEVDEGGTEIVAYDAKTAQLFSINGAEKALEILDLSQLEGGDAFTSLSLTKQIKLADLDEQLAQVSDMTSVAVSPQGDYVAVSVPAEPKTDAGYVVFFHMDGKYAGHVEVGSLPDMVTITSDGKQVVVANEGEPSDDLTLNPKGSVSIISIDNGLDTVTQEDVTTLYFQGNIKGLDQVRKVNPDATLAEDVEPEYVRIDGNDQKAYVGLQENNAIAIVNLETLKIESVHNLGYKDMSMEANGMDASDKDDRIHITPYPVLSMYQPDTLALLEQDGETYLLTANEGDAMDYHGFSEEARVADIADQVMLNEARFAGFSQEELDAWVEAGGLTDPAQLGRLKVTTSAPVNAEGKYEAIYGYGARSFSIWNTKDMSQVYDSGNDFEKRTAAIIPDYFNSDNDENEADKRSDDKGPEPEAIAVGELDGSSYAFVGLERTGGIMVYDVTDVTQPAFEQYVTTRRYEGEDIAGDVAPEGMIFVSSEHSPTGEALLIAAHEVSGTIAIYEVKTKPMHASITILHTNDSHARVFEGKYDGMGFAKLATLVEQYRDMNEHTLLLDAGDTLHGTNFATLVRGSSIVEVLNEIGYDGMAPGNHDFNYGYERLKELEKEMNFPLYSANVRDKATGERVFNPYVIEEIDGLRLGIFGLSTPETHYKTHPKNVEHLLFTDPVVEAQGMVQILERQNVDAIIAVTHLGIDESSTDTSIKVAEGAPGIDLIVDGHSHTTLVEGLEGANDTLIVSSGEYTKNLGVVELTFEAGELTDAASRLISKEEATDVAEHPEVVEVLQRIEKEQEKVLSQVVGSTKVILDGEREQVRTGETNLGNLITDAMLHMTRADVALTNGGGIRASIEAGEITKGDVITVLPFGNYIVTKEVTGEQIIAALENGVSAYPEAKGAFPHVAGMTYQIDASKPAGERVHHVKIKGQPIDLKASYVLATNDFLAAGGDEYEMFTASPILNEYPALDEALITYIQERGEVKSKVEGRITAAKASQADSKPELALPQHPDDKPAQQPKVYVVRAGDTLYRIAIRHGVTWQEIQALNKLSNPHLIYPGQNIQIPAS
ncbi:choice-of-anchor I family protein [Marinicrinis sediminis]|uniref:Choice-of-anchor I family protein n=1 Tax=Marinicrinis sediminis TaxID=1652465 RepID=A0ABW5REJ1_9BACL